MLLVHLKKYELVMRRKRQNMKWNGYDLLVTYQQSRVAKEAHFLIYLLMVLVIPFQFIYILDNIT